MTNTKYTVLNADRQTVGGSNNIAKCYELIEARDMEFFTILKHEPFGVASRATTVVDAVMEG